VRVRVKPILAPASLERVNPIHTQRERARKTWVHLEKAEEVAPLLDVHQLGLRRDGFGLGLYTMLP